MRLKSIKHSPHFVFIRLSSTLSKASINNNKPLNTPLRIAFCGSDLFSIHSFKFLLQYAAKHPEHVERIDLVTRKPKPAGRGRKTVQSVPILDQLEDLTSKYLVPVGSTTNSLPSIQTFTPESKQEFLDLQAVRNYNLAIAVSYGKLIPHQFLSLLQFGGLNVHPSLLPKYSGASPLHSALLNRDPYTGVTVQTLHPKEFDKGDILFQSGPISVPSLLKSGGSSDSNGFNLESNDILLSNGSTFGLPSIPVNEPSPCRLTTSAIIESSPSSPPLLSLTNSLGLLGAKSLISILHSKTYETPEHNKIVPEYPYSYSPRIPSSATEIFISQMDIDTVLVNNRVLGELYLWQQVEEKKKKKKSQPEEKESVAAKENEPTLKRVQINGLHDMTDQFIESYPKDAQEMQLGEWKLLNVENPKEQSKSLIAIKVKAGKGKEGKEEYGFLAASEFKLQGFQKCSAYQLSKSMKKWGIVYKQFVVK